MKTVGSMLRQAREAKKLSLEQVEKATKIRKRFLSDIESDDYSSLPSAAYAKGFVKNYADFLGIDSYATLAYFRRQTKDVSRSSLLPKKEDETLSPSPFRMTPSRFLVSLVTFLVIVFLAYLVLQYRSIAAPPDLVIDSPVDNALLKERRVEVFGKTDPDATVTINGISVLTRSDGKFFDQVMLEPGVNTITITATSRFGKVATGIRQIEFQPD